MAQVNYIIITVLEGLPDSSMNMETLSMNHTQDISTCVQGIKLQLQGNFWRVTVVNRRRQTNGTHPNPLNTTSYDCAPRRGICPVDCTSWTFGWASANLGETSRCCHSAKVKLLLGFASTRPASCNKMQALGTVFLLPVFTRKHLQPRPRTDICMYRAHAHKYSKLHYVPGNPHNHPTFPSPRRFSKITHAYCLTYGIQAGHRSIQGIGPKT